MAFEMTYVMTNAVPARAPAWTVLHERVEILANSCAALAAYPGAPETIRAVGEKAAEIAATLNTTRATF